MAARQLVHLIEAGEVPPRLGRGVDAERLDRTGQIGQGFTDGNQLAALTMHGYILPCPADKTREAELSAPTILEVRQLVWTHLLVIPESA